MSDETLDGSLQNERWWDKATDDEKSRSAWQTAAYLRDRDSARRRQLYLYMRMYGNADPRNVWGSSGDFVRLLPDGRLALNVVARVIDAAVARVVVNRPKPVYQTVGGNASLRKRARLLERFVDSEFMRLDLRGEANKSLTDAASFGSGMLKVYKAVGPGGQGRAEVERVYPGEVLVDPLEGLYGKPRTMYQVKFYPRTVEPSQLGAAPEDVDHVRDLLVNANTSYVWEDFGRDPTADQVEVLEAWRLPAPDWDGESDEGVGVHIVALSNGCVACEPWKHRYFPIMKVDWFPEMRGYWGKGLTDRVLGLQVEINRILIRIQQAMHLMAVPRIMAEQGSRIAQQQINNAIGAILSYVGAPPTFMTAPSMHPEVYGHLAFLIKQAMEIAGTGDETQAVTPGTRSEVQARFAHSQRNLALTKPIQAWDQLYMGVAERIVDIYREVDAETPGGFKTVAAQDKYTISQLNWSEVDMERDQYNLRVYPASALPDDPQGRRVAVSDMLDRGLITDPAVANRLLEMPDNEAETDLANAVADNIDRQLEEMLDDGKWSPPEPYQDPALCLKRGQMVYNKACKDKVPEDRKQLLRDYMAMAHSYLQKAAMAAQAQMAAAAPATGTAPIPAGPNGAPPLQ